MTRPSGRLTVIAGMLIAGSLQVGLARQAATTPVVIGAPAPVPPQVAILRPTEAEIAQVNAAVKAFVSTNKSAAKDLLRKYEPLLLLQTPRLNTAATFTQTRLRMGPRHLEFVETAKAGNIDLLLHGDSITDWWVQGDENKQMFAKYFGHIKNGKLRDRRRHHPGRVVGLA